MLHLKCTAKIQKAIKLSKDQLVPPEAEPVSTPLGHWYVHRFAVGRTHFYLFMSETSLLSFVLYQGKKPVTTKTLPLMLMLGLRQLLTMKGLPLQRIERLLQDCTPVLFSKTDSRKLLGSMNDLVHCYSSMIEAQGGLKFCDLTQTILQANSMPQRTLGWRTSWEVAVEMLA